MRMWMMWESLLLNKKLFQFIAFESLYNIIAHIKVYKN